MSIKLFIAGIFLSLTAFAGRPEWIQLNRNLYISKNSIKDMANKDKAFTYSHYSVVRNGIANCDEWSFNNLPVGPDCLEDVVLNYLCYNKMPGDTK